MNSKLVNPQTKPHTIFPSLHRWKAQDIITLFLSENNGIVVHIGAGGRKLGEAFGPTVCCNDAGWELFHGEVTLSN